MYQYNSNEQMTDLQPSLGTDFQCQDTFLPSNQTFTTLLRPSSGPRGSARCNESSDRLPAASKLGQTRASPGDGFSTSPLPLPPLSPAHLPWLPARVSLVNSVAASQEAKQSDLTWTGRRQARQAPRQAGRHSRQQTQECKGGAHGTAGRQWPARRLEVDENGEGALARPRRIPASPNSASP